MNLICVEDIAEDEVEIIMLVVSGSSLAEMKGDILLVTGGMLLFGAWFCFIGFDSGWRDGVCCFHIAIAMIYSDDFCVSEFLHKKYLRFRID